MSSQYNAKNCTSDIGLFSLILVHHYSSPFSSPCTPAPDHKTSWPPILHVKRRTIIKQPSTVNLRKCTKQLRKCCRKSDKVVKMLSKCWEKVKKTLRSVWESWEKVHKQFIERKGEKSSGKVGKRLRKKLRKSNTKVLAKPRLSTKKQRTVEKKSRKSSQNIKQKLQKK